MQAHTTFSHAQLTGVEAHDAFLRNVRPAMIRALDEAVPGIERPWVTRAPTGDSEVESPMDRAAPTFRSQELDYLRTQRLGRLTTVDGPPVLSCCYEQVDRSVSVLASGAARR